MFANRARTTFIVAGSLVMLALTATVAGAQSSSPLASPSSEAPFTPAATPASLPPAGRWQVVLSADELIAAGAPRDGATAGTYTWTFDGDRARIDLQPDEGEAIYCRGTMAPVGDRVRLAYEVAGACGNSIDELRWRLDPEGLHLVLVATNQPYDANRAFMEAKPWQPVAAASPSTGPSAAPTGWEAAASEPWIAYFDAGTRLVHPDGTGEHQIALDFPGNLTLPDWSPDGQRLAMTSRDTGGTEPVYEYDLATGVYRQLFACEDPCLTDDEPAYSPDGTKVVFDRALGPWTDTGPTDCGLWIGDIASGEVTQITSNPGCYREYSPRWSPDGSQLAYWRWQEDPPGVTTGTASFVIDADGTDERQLTDWEVMAGDPDWSPDGEWLVYSTYPLLAFASPPAGSNLYRVRPDGTGTEQLTFNSDATHRATQPRYTPDGRSIVFTADRPETRTISVMPADGGDSRVVVDRGTHGTWQPEMEDRLPPSSPAPTDE